MPILRWFSCSQENKLFCRQKNKTKPNNNFSPCSIDAHYLDCLFCLCLSCVQPNADKLLLFCFVFLHKKDILMIIRVSQWFQLIYRYLIGTWVSQVRFHCLFRGITRSSFENPTSKVLGFFYLLCCHYCCSSYQTNKTLMNLIVLNHESNSTLLKKIKYFLMNGVSSQLLTHMYENLPLHLQYLIFFVISKQGVLEITQERTYISNISEALLPVDALSNV